MLLGIAVDILGAGLKGGLEHLVGARRRGRIDDLADAIEQKADAVGLAERTAGLGKGGADFAGGAVAVVGQRLDDDSGAARPIAFIADLVKSGVGLAAGAAADRAIDGVLGHVGLARRQHRGAQARVCRRIGQPGAGRRRQFPDDLGKDLGALFVLRTFPVHDVFELGMASHRSLRGFPRVRVLFDATAHKGSSAGLTTQYGSIAAWRDGARQMYQPFGAACAWTTISCRPSLGARQMWS